MDDYRDLNATFFVRMNRSIQKVITSQCNRCIHGRLSRSVAGTDKLNNIIQAILAEARDPFLQIEEELFLLFNGILILVMNNMY